MSGEENEALVRLPLESRHEALGARFAPFAGWRMPLQYTGIKDEHAAVRNAVGIFDVSHMGNFVLTGPEAVRAIDRIVTNDIGGLPVGKAAYTVMCREDGGIVDDLVVYKLAEERLLIVVNASRRAVDWDHMQQHLEGDATLEDHTERYALLAVQGPRAVEMLEPRATAELASVERYAAVETTVCGVDVVMGRTGYTGEDGFEILIPVSDAEAVFDGLMEAGEAFGLQPVGLGARDTLRLEAKYPLYGNDLTTETNPLEAGLAWVVKLGKEVPFVGQKRLQTLRRERAVTRRLRGVVLDGRGVLRAGYPLFAGDAQVGSLTSGTMSPTLGQAIGLGYVAAEHADAESGIEVEIRGRRLPVSLTRKAFYRGL